MNVRYFLAALVWLVSSMAWADIEWSGTYRIEGNFIKNSELDGRNREKAYGLHHLVLKPKIIAADGLNIYGRFDVLNSEAYSNSQLGQIFGHGVRDSSTAVNATTGDDDSNVLSQRQSSETLQVNHLYLTLTQEFGALIAGRAPIHFGLGMFHNAGEGLFDHWFDTRDMVGYKMVMGNIFFMPMVAKVNEGNLHESDDVTDLMVQLEYDNPETDIRMGVFFQKRDTNPSGNDTSDIVDGSPTATREEYSVQNTNLFVLKDTDTYRIGVEGGFQSGKTGLDTGSNVSMSGFGLALEYEYRAKNSLWKYGVKAGHATGDDPATIGKFEGYVFDKNYDVAFLLFNHPLGQEDFFRTSSFGGSNKPYNDTNAVINSPDTEAISNVSYLSPYIKYQWSDQWQIFSSLTTGYLGTSPLAGEDVDKSLGYELDFSLNFVPNKKVKWMNQIGLFMPGAAFKGGSNNFDTKMSYGLMTRAAISF